MEPLTRAEKIKILASMGVDVPENTKVPDDDLEKRLRAALDAAQEKSRFSTPLDIQTLPRWPLITAGEINTSSRPLLDAVNRGNIQEIMHNIARGSRKTELYVDPFLDLRQTMLSLAGNVLDRGLDWCTIQDPEKEKSAIHLRFLHILELDKMTPAMVLLYRAYTPQNAAEGLLWIEDRVDQNADVVGGLGMNIKATLLEQKLLLMLLSMNTKLLPTDFKVKRQRYEEHYRASVLLPIGPLGPEAIAKLASKSECVVCGKHGSRRCGGCLSVSYCGPDCQKSDWPAHKPTCRSLKGGRWVKVRFRAVSPGTEGMHVGLFNRYTSLARPEDIFATTTLPTDPSKAEPFPNVHGDKPFLIKMQVGLTGPARDTFMVYDRQRSFGTVFIARMDDPQMFAELLSEMMGSRGGYGGVKMYRWAKRMGDWELGVCIDRQPEGEIKW
ncbi:hypothetical protein PYCCODRAFT_1389695 [Trametes coccinea BRFM310]|uniref:MYND-type domain-containing protein n=1 Tax=Trametes coccinea (strain BRFM310) TaxID=1353009 RepID=A0A1Y2IPL6_TRAC3|nr:hypothetical protein PYCCODRAFT_1389695 [Trametes coccinea BRFM310]